MYQAPFHSCKSVVYFLISVGDKKKSPPLSVVLWKYSCQEWIKYPNDICLSLVLQHQCLDRYAFGKWGSPSMPTRVLRTANAYRVSLDKHGAGTRDRYILFSAVMFPVAFKRPVKSCLYAFGVSFTHPLLWYRLVCAQWRPNWRAMVS